MLYAVTAFIAWFSAQLIKQMLFVAGYNQKALGGNSYSSGGMPSGHSATVVALTTIVGLTHGLHSVLFGICIVLTVIVMYDAMTVRFSSGEQGDTLNKLLKKTRSDIAPVKVAHGHLVVEVLAGALLGMTIGIVVFFTIK